MNMLFYTANRSGLQNLTALQQRNEEIRKKFFDQPLPEYLSSAQKVEYQELCHHYDPETIHFPAAPEAFRKWEWESLLFERQKMALFYTTETPTRQWITTAEGQKFREILKTYIAKPSLFRERKDLEFRPSETAQIDAAIASYPEFVRKLIERDGKSRGKDQWIEGFVKWCLRANLGVDIFVEAPHEVDVLMKAHLDKRLGVQSQSRKDSPLQFRVVSGQKTVTLTIQGQNGPQNVPIQGTAHRKRTVAIYSRDGGRHEDMTVEKVLKVFRDKNHDYGNLELADQKVFLWDSIHPVTQDFSTWIDQVPFYPVTMEQIRRFDPSFTPSETGQPILGIMANRESDNLCIRLTHAYLMIIRRKEDGSYEACPIGFQMEKLPLNGYETLKNLYNTVRGGVHIPDEGFVLGCSNRANAGKMFTLSDDEFTAFKAVMAKRLEDAERGHLPFQALGSNCAEFVQGVYDETFGAGPQQGTKFYETTFFSKGVIVPIFGPILNLVKRASGRIQTIVLQAFAFLLGGWRTYRLPGSEAKVSVTSVRQRTGWGRLLLPAHIFPRWAPSV
jgi:hypothetical protein